MELDTIFDLMADYQAPDPRPYIGTQFETYMRQYAKPSEFSDQILLNLPHPRVDYYSSTDFDSLQRNVVAYVNHFVQSLGFYPVQAQMFILQEMQIFNYSTLLLGLIFNVILLVFVVISVLLIYSLLMIGVETKTSETGIMRMLGTNKSGLITMVAIQSILFVSPAVIAAFILCFPLIGVCYTQIFNEKLSDGFEPIPQPSAVLQALAVGIFIPFVSAILPIFRVLNQNLNDALNFQRSRVKAVYVEIMAKNKMNIVPYLIFGIITFLYGFSIYYLLPYSLLTLKLGLILEVFFFILMGLLLGLVLLAINT